ncbi:MAG TPA: thioredoxin family protein, partial [Methanothrix soehngenii]|nr:thioredoxin family protein [Methanothrix soehngenii]
PTVNQMVKIEVMGTGCAKCKSLLKNVQKAVEESGTDAEIIKVDSIQEIMDRGVMMTPALYIDGKSVLTGRTATVEELKRMLKR